MRILLASIMMISLFHLSASADEAGLSRSFACFHRFEPRDGFNLQVLRFGTDWSSYSCETHIRLKDRDYSTECRETSEGVIFTDGIIRGRPSNHSIVVSASVMGGENGQVVLFPFTQSQEYYDCIAIENPSS